MAFSTLITISSIFMILFLNHFDDVNFKWLGFLSFSSDAKPFLKSTFLVVFYICIQAVAIESQFFVMISSLLSSHPNFIKASIAMFLICTLASLLFTIFIYGWFIGSITCILFLLIGSPAVDTALKVSCKCREDIIQSSQMPELL